MNKSSRQTFKLWKGFYTLKNIVELVNRFLAKGFKCSHCCLKYVLHYNINITATRYNSVQLRNVGLILLSNK